jgi:outer membrane protein OmpA-like peptidoglycan-associated protein/tetratricopeptide (TPR) repeat protein
MKRLIFLLLLIPVFGFCQPRYTSSNKAAVKSYENALRYYDSYQNEHAKAELERSLAKDPKFIEAYVLLANVYIDMRNYEAAIEQYKTAIGINPNFFPNNYYTLANIELSTGKYEDAKVHYQKYLTFEGTNNQFRINAQERILTCDFAIDALKNPVPFKPENLGTGVNSEYDEYFPTITVDDQTMIYTRNRPDQPGSQRYHEDFYISKRKDGKWDLSVNSGTQLNSSGNEGVPNLSSDGKLLFFAACDRQDGKGSCDLYYSRLRPEGWTKPINLGFPINTGAWESQPSFASDGRTLYFIRGSISRDGIKEQDIYFSVISDEGKWSEPSRLNNKINTSGEEEFVFVHPDNQTLYFSSDGHPGMGHLDIYVSRRQANGEWGIPENLGYPINTYKDERGMLVGPKGNIAYISSDREGGIGGLDLYSFELYEEVRPQLISYVKGIVSDANTGAKLEAAFEILDLETGKTVIKSSSEKITGEFLACLTAGKDYSLNVSKEGYLFYSDHFSCKDPADLKNAYVLDVKLSSAKEGGKVVLKNVFYDTNLYNLKPESFPELDKLVAFMVANKKINIELSGHTDSTGDKQKNLILSENRAKAVYDYLTGKGVEPSRLTFKGYGDSRPVDSNETPEGRAQNRRTEFKITSVSKI